MKVAVIGVIAACLLVAGTAFASEELAKKSNCMMCHPLDKKAMGPSMKDMGTKFKKDADGAKKIEEAIKKGSKGVYGEKSSMGPQDKVSEADAKAIATWMLTLAGDAAPAAAPAK